jgi:hypothetical protein
MSNAQDTIGLTQLLDEVSNDLDETRKKLPGDYTIKNATMWWELEKERLLTRHGPTKAVRKLLKHRSMKRALLAFCAGCAAVVAATVLTRVLIP